MTGQRGAVRLEGKVSEDNGINHVEVRNLFVTYGEIGQLAKDVVRNVSFSVAQAQSLVILGESGSGKSVTLRALLALPREEGAQVRGHIRIGSTDVLTAGLRMLRRLRGRGVGFIFQEPMTAFDPVFNIGAQISETIAFHHGCSRQKADAETLRLLELVQIPSARQRMRAYPHELSGGLRQRAMIAMALCCGPDLLLADEPTTALDATVQIQILLLLREIQRDRRTSMILVTHDLGVAAMIGDQAAVMLDGEIIETGEPGHIIKNPRHPYTLKLMQSISPSH